MTAKILVPVDGSPHANKAIEFAANMKMNHEPKIYFLHVAKKDKIPKEIEDLIRSEGLKNSADTVYLEFAGRQILESARDLARKCGLEQVETAVVRGDPAEAIIKYARDQDFDLIVIGSRGLGTAKGSMLGSVSRKVCEGSDRTCVIVKKGILHGLKILAVDDEPDILDTLEELLDMCEIVKATTFEEAKALLQSENFDFAILDIMGVRGYDLLQIANRKKIMAVMLTGHALSPKNTVRAYKEGAASFVPKDELANIKNFLMDILEAKEKGKNFWWRWLERFDDYYSGKFTADWKTKNDKAFWDKFNYM